MDYINEKTITIFGEPIRISNECKLTTGERFVYCIIYAYCSKGKNKECALSLECFSQWTGLTRQGVIKALKSLEEIGLIKKEIFIRDDSNVIRCKYLLIPRAQKSRAEQKAEVRARAEVLIEEYKRREYERKLRAAGLEPVPIELEGQGWLGIRTESDGSKTLIADGKRRQVDERYMSKDDFDALFDNNLDINDI